MVPYIPELVNSDFNTLRVARMHEVEMQAVIAPLYSEDCPQVSSERTAGEETYFSLTRECPGSSRRAVRFLLRPAMCCKYAESFTGGPVPRDTLHIHSRQANSLYSSPNGHRPVFRPP
jgi:hypothetical protein